MCPCTVSLHSKGAPGIRPTPFRLAGTRPPSGPSWNARQHRPSASPARDGFYCVPRREKPPRAAGAKNNRPIFDLHYEPIREEGADGKTGGRRCVLLSNHQREDLNLSVREFHTERLRRYTTAGIFPG